MKTKGVLARRSAAALVDSAAVLLALSLGLWLDSATAWLTPYDGAQLGISAAAGALIIIEAILGATLGKLLLRIRIVRRSGERASGSRLLVRGIAFWTLLGAPSTVLTPFLTAASGPSVSTLLAFNLATSLTWWAALPLSAVATNGHITVLDLLTGTRVARYGTEYHEHIRQAPRLLRLTGLVAVAALAYVSALRYSREVPILDPVQMEALQPYLATAVRTAGTAAEAIEVFAGPRASDYYVPDDATYALNGRAFYFRIPVDLRVLATPRARRDAVLQAWKRVLYLTPGARWVEFELFNYRQLGFVAVRRSTFYILTPKDADIMPRPRRVAVDSGPAVGDSTFAFPDTVLRQATLMWTTFDLGRWYLIRRAGPPPRRYY